jgi:catechol 2,3-dioxygenase-like lactoylglutathione lyase family enzyme
MIGYVSVGTNDIKRAAAYYDKLMDELGAKRIMDFGSFIVWGTGKGKPAFALAEPYNKMPATVGNGVMIAFSVDNPAKVDALYKKALELGGSDEGPPGDRGDKYYGAYFRDLDGNKLNFHCWT